MNTLQLIETKQINNVPVDGWYGTKQAWFTRFQIGEALEYDNPNDAIAKIHDRHKERLDKYSRLDKLSNEVQTYNVYLYSIRGVLEICRWSRQPKADMVMDALYDMAMEVMEKGYFSLLSDDELLGIITEKQRQNKEFLNKIDKTAIKSKLLTESRSDKQQDTDLLFLCKTEMDIKTYRAKLKAIWKEDTVGFHKNLDEYMKWYNKVGYKLI